MLAIVARAAVDAYVRPPLHLGADGSVKVRPERGDHRKVDDEGEEQGEGRFDPRVASRFVYLVTI